jgi:methylmalonyl-CoA mutase N-terminal domain/subunit
LRTQQIIAHESGAADSIDPLAGSYLIEQLTDEIESQAEAYIQKIDDMGGALAAIERGYQQSEIQEAAYQYQQAVERQEQIVVGVNKFEVEEQLDLDQLKVDPAIEKGQRARLAAIRERRDSQKASELLGQLEKAANSDESLVPLFVECVENDLTLGEICGVLRKVWGEYQPSTWI